MKKVINFIEGPLCQRFILTLVILNAIVLGLETSATVMQHVGSYLIMADKIMLMIFTLEIAIKIAAYRTQFVKDPWRIFDFIVVGIALIPASGNLSVLRAFRVMRVFRVISVLPSLRKVINALLHALPGLSSIMIIMLVVYYVFAVMATKLFGAAFPDWFGTMGRSMYSLFQIMTLESWSMGIVRPVMQVFPYAWLFFVSYILVSTFMVLNLFIAVVVDAMQSGADETSANETAKELKAIRKEIAQLRKILDK